MNRSTLLILALVFAGLFCLEAYGARLVKAVISLDGKPVLEASYGDDGDADADEVWMHLKEITFQPTSNFPLASDDQRKEMTLESRSPMGSSGGVVIHIDYGGRAEKRRLRLLRVPPDELGREWKLNPADVNALFKSRSISRADVARLKNPQATNR